MIAILFVLAAASPPELTAPAELPDHPLTVSPEDYPIDALKAGAEGVAVVVFTVGIDGVPVNCRVTGSASDPGLDAASCKIIERTRFRPALDHRRQPVAVEATKRIRWQIDWAYKPPAIAMIDRYQSLRFSIGADGNVTGCLEVDKQPLPDDGRTCDAMANALPSTLQGLIGRPTIGLAAIELRRWFRVVETFGPVAPSAADALVGRVITAADVEIAGDGRVSSCVASKSADGSEINGGVCSMVGGEAGFEADARSATIRRLQIRMEGFGYAARPAEWSGQGAPIARTIASSPGG